MNCGPGHAQLPLEALMMLWAQGKAVAEQWLLKLFSLAPPSLLFFGAPKASRHFAEVIVAPQDHMNTSAESLHYKLLLRCK